MLRARRSAIIEKWLGETLKSYPAETARVFGAEADRFRNPAGHALRENLAALFDAVMLSDDWDHAARALGELVQLRAVQDFTAAQAVGFILPLKTILREAMLTDDLLTRLDARVDRLMLLAPEMYATCRARMAEISSNEARRRTWVAGQIAERLQAPCSRRELRLPTEASREGSRPEAPTMPEARSPESEASR